MDPSCTGLFTPSLSRRWMLIPRVHVHMEAKRIRDLWYQYTGYTICFMKKTFISRLINRLILVLPLHKLRDSPNPGPGSGIKNMASIIISLKDYKLSLSNNND